MAPQLNRKLVINILGLVVALGLFGFLFTQYAWPGIQKWREASKELSERQKRRDQLRKAFADQDDPKIELRTLKEEIKNLKKTNEALEKVKKDGTEVADLPEELNDPDPEIRRELLRQYIGEVMEVTEKSLKRDLKDARISPPDIKLYTDLDNAAEAAYYMNRATGLRGIVDAMAKTQSEGNSVIFEKLILEDYETGKDRRSGAGNILSYQLKMTLDAKSLMALLYNLNETDAYYFVEDMAIESAGRGRQTLSVDARINTVLVYRSEVEKQIKAGAAGGAAKKKKTGAVGGFLALAFAMQEEAKKQVEAQKNKKWYEFWK